MAPKRVAILGSTGSIGTQALDLLRSRRDRFQVVALTANRSLDTVQQQVAEFAPSAACLAGAAPLELPSGRLEGGAASKWIAGADGILEALELSQPDVVLNGITGFAGMAASEWTLNRGLPLALANKESLVVAGEHLMPLAERTGAPILPVDSEHCAIHQCLRGGQRGEVKRIWLTASGGPFRERALDSFPAIRPDEALKHPTWSMGPRITVGSATMMNKAFEVIEAHHLFGLSNGEIEVVIHPQSVIHSMVEWQDGSILAQLGKPDMRVPILYCLAYPERVPFDFEPFDPLKIAQLEFQPVDPDRYPAVPLAFEILNRGGDSGAMLNAADEVLTEMFLEGRVLFPGITETVRKVVHSAPPKPLTGLQDVYTADARGRQLARELVGTAPKT